jgi:hypothetical protein
METAKAQATSVRHAYSSVSTNLYIRGQLLENAAAHYGTIRDVRGDRAWREPCGHASHLRRPFKANLIWPNFEK